MPSGDFSDLPNPFAPEPVKRGANRNVKVALRPLLTSLKLLTLVVVIFALYMVVTTQGPELLASRLASDFDTLDVNAKQERLNQFSELGIAGIQPLTIALADPEIEVAQSAHRLIGRLQNQWTADTKEQADACKQRLDECLSQVDQYLDGERKAWVADLNGERLATDDEIATENPRHDHQPNQQVNEIDTSVVTHQSVDHERNNELSDESLPSAILMPPNVYRPPVSAHQATIPQETDGPDSQWPPARIAQVGFVAEKKSTFETSYSVESNVTEQSDELQENVSHDDTILYRNVRDPLDQMPIAQPDVSQPETPLSLRETDTRSVIAALGSSNESLRLLAESELTNRGFDELQVGLAKVVATGNVQQRIELISHLVSSESIDPRPWLLLLLDDEDRKVKTEAVFALARTLDPDVRKALRLHLAGEPDQTVALQIRDVLNLR